jgi:hypothetical protein
MLGVPIELGVLERLSKRSLSYRREDRFWRRQVLEKASRYDKKVPKTPHFRNTLDGSRAALLPENN